jgi:PEP-CTERM putative exosortase interaction domain
VWEWNDGVIGSSRGLRGGSWANSDFILQSSFRFSLVPSDGSAFIGFRVASVPEPSTAVLVLMGAGALYFWKRRRATL